MVPILDNGHGGIINGIYQTEGKRSPDWDEGILYEGAFNRWIVNGIIEELDSLEIPYYHISPELTDTSLKTRVNRANKIASTNDVYVLSIHANAGGGTGIEGFTSLGNTTSDIIADDFLSDLQNTFLDVRFRYDYSDGDKDKEAAFYILQNTICPAFLLELGFMDNKHDYDLLWDKDWRQRIINCLTNTIIDLL